jgi:hypothetical protein
VPAIEDLPTRPHFREGSVLTIPPSRIRDEQPVSPGGGGNAIAEGQTTPVIGFEALKLADMVRTPKAKREPALGGIVRHVRYKAARRNNIVVEVALHYSSQECSRCGHPHPNNRRDQRFACQERHFTAHADAGASRVMKKQNIAKVRLGELEVQAKAHKRISIRRKDVVEGGGLLRIVCGALVSRTAG